MRDRRLPPGPATPPDSVDANQRERLCAALVAVSEEKGFDEARIEDLVRLSGVSRRDFYKRFQDKEDCLIATVRAIAEIANEGTPSVEEDPPGETVEEAIERAKASLSEFLELIHGQPAAARLFFCESYAGGPEALKAVDEAALNFVARIRRRLESIPGYSSLPDKLPHAIVGGYHKLIQSRLYRREEDALPGLASEMTRWALSYPPPPVPLRAPRRRPPGSNPALPRGTDPADRLLRALASIVAEQGYPRATVAEIVRRASTSQRTFYEHFSGREDAMMAAIDRGSAALLATILPASRRADTWQESVRLGLEALLHFGASEPEYALLGTVGGYALGQPAFEQRDHFLARFEALMLPGFELRPDAPRIAPEAIGGALLVLIYEQIRRDGPESLPAIAPLGTYVALAPFVGPEEAAREANSRRH